MTNTISVRQVCIILFAYNAISKLLLYPTHMSALCGNALLVPQLINFAVQTGIVWGIAHVSSKTDKTFYQILCSALGNVWAKIVMFLFALYFLFISFLSMSEQQIYVSDIFYDTIPSITVFLPVFFFMLYVGTKDFLNVGRCADICLPIFAVAIACIFAMSISECRWDAFLPVFNTPTKSILKATFAGTFRFFDGAILLMLLGHFKYQKGDGAKLTLSYALGGVVVLAFSAIFYAVYSYLSPNQSFAISKLSMFFSAINLIGRLDLIALYVLDIVSLFAIALNVQMCIYCLMHTFNVKNSVPLSVIVNGVLFTALILFNHKFTLVQQIGSASFVATLAFSCVAPVICLIYAHFSKRRGAR